MALKIGKISKAEIMSKGYEEVGCFSSSPITSENLNYKEPDNYGLLHPLRRIFRTNQSFTKSLISNGTLYSYQYHANGYFNLFQIDLNEIKSIKTQDSSSIVIEEGDGNETVLETTQSPEQLKQQIEKSMDNFEPRLPKVTLKKMH